ncbi:MAG: hypothetical protein ACE5KV_00830 [Thermoplasmata archaeon]
MTFKPYKEELRRINHTVGFWVNVTSDSNLTVAGLVPMSTSIPLMVGWNLVGFPSLGRTYTVAYLKAETGTTHVEAFDWNASPYLLKDMQNSDFLKAGHGYWVYIPNEIIWTVWSVLRPDPDCCRHCLESLCLMEGLVEGDISWCI